MTDNDMLSFGVEYEIVDESCDDAGCDGCTHRHRRQTGRATLTLVGRRDLIQQAAASVFPDMAAFLNPPKVQASVVACVACGASSADGIPIHAGRCPECEAGGWRPVGVGERALSAEQLDALPTGTMVTAGGFHENMRHERVGWIKLDVPWPSRWQSPAGEASLGKPGVSAAWLAINRDARLLAAPAPHWGDRHD